MWIMVGDDPQQLVYYTYFVGEGGVPNIIIITVYASLALVGRALPAQGKELLFLLNTGAVSNCAHL